MLECIRASIPSSPTPLYKRGIRKAPSPTPSFVSATVLRKLRQNVYDFTSPSPAWFSYCFTQFYLVFVRVSFFHFFTHILFPFISPQLYLNLFPSCDSKTIFLYRPVKALCVRPLFRPILTAIGQHKRGETLGSDSVQFFRLSVSSNSTAAAAATISHTQYTHTEVTTTYVPYFIVDKKKHALLHLKALLPHKIERDSRRWNIQDRMYHFFDVVAMERLRKRNV